MLLKKKIKDIFKETRYYKFIRIIYLFFTRKGFKYHFLQKRFLSFNSRNYLGKIEKLLVNLIFFKDRSFFKKYFYKENNFSKMLKIQGISEPFVLESLSRYKNEIIDYYEKNKIFDDKNPSHFFLREDRKPNLKVGYYDTKVTARCPYMFDLINDPFIVKTLSNYFKSPFKLDYVNAWWSFKNVNSEINEKTQFFHRDVDNFNFIKVFIYLTDVDLEDGPNEYIIKSHINSYGAKINHRHFYDSDMTEEMKSNLFSFKGKSGTAIFANTYGLHRGKTPKKNDRLILVLSYSLLNTFYCPEKPFLHFNDIKTNQKKINSFLNSSYLI